ncbi:MAG: hypothetical protein GXP24_08665 [Planctomycetes bacterium]|nr:hypothetical protein [Planctomycetota bacterium]
MHDYQLSVTVSDQQWKSAIAHASAGHSEEDFFAEYGATPMIDDSRRRFRRVRARGRALALQRGDRYGVLTSDVSPMGIGFFSPVPFLPKELIILCFEQSEQITLEIRRCYRTDHQGYSCGGNFQSGPMPPGAYREFLDELKV